MDKMKLFRCGSAYVCALVGLWIAPVFGGTGERMDVWPEGKMPSVQANQPFKPYMVWFTPKERKTDAVLIAVSGGGYGGNAIEGFEVSPIRDYMLAKGMTVVTMRYRTPRPKGLPKHVTAWQDAQRTVRVVRHEAKRRGLDPDRIGFTGCSAGGHLAMMVAVSSQTPAYAPVDELDKLPCNVNFAIPVYPAYLLTDGLDQYNVKKGNDLSDGFASELAFDAATPPMCFFHGDWDVWSAMGSVRAYHKLRTMGLPAELHVFALENHCFQSNPRPGTPAFNWKDRAWEWLVSLDVVTGHPATWTKDWKSAFPTWGKLEQAADFEPGAWRAIEWGGQIVTAFKDSPIWLKGEYGDFELDFEYRLDPGANSGVIIRCSDPVNWIPNAVEVQLLDDENAKWKDELPNRKGAGLYGHLAPRVAGTTHPARTWNRMTIRAEGRRVKVVNNGVVTVDADLGAWTSAKVNPDGSPIPSWLSRPWAELDVKGRVGFQGRHGDASPCFRNVRIRALAR